MACFTVPLAEAIIVTAAKAVFLKKKSNGVCDGKKKIKVEHLREKIGTLQKMLYGGSFLLAIEHLYHGELSLVPPFLTAMKNPEEIPAMLHEMATVGTGMALLTTAVWGIELAASRLFKRISFSKKSSLSV